MFEFLRAKIFAAGLLFAVLTAVPIIAMSRLLGLFGLGMPAGSRHIKAEYAQYSRICSVAIFSIFSYFFALSTQVLFISTPARHQPYWWTVLTFGSMTIALGIWQQWLESRPLLVTVATVAAAVMFLFSLYKSQPRTVAIATYWFYSVGIAFIFLRYLFLASATDNRKRFDWERWSLVSTGIVFAFATTIYGSMKPAWGGGAVAPITIHFSRPTAFSNALDIRHI
jgi:hypothetical protein